MLDSIFHMFFICYHVFGAKTSRFLPYLPSIFMGHRVSFHSVTKICAGPRSAVGNMSGYRCVSDCRSRGREFDPGPVPYFRGD